MEVRIIASLIAKPDFFEDVKEILHQIIEPSRAESGNLQSAIRSSL